MDQAARKTREVGSEAQKLAQKAEGFRLLGQAGVAVGVAILGVGAAALKTGVAYNTLQQSSRKALTTMLGSADAAKQQMDVFDEFVRKSPYAKQTFLAAQQQMIAFGIATKNVIPYLDAVQNAVAAAGGGNAELAGIVAIMSKIQSSAKITAVDLMQFGNYGVNAAELIGISMGKTGAQIREEITNGSIDAETALDALTKGMAVRFAGASAGLKETFAGSTDRMKAAWRDFSAELAKPLVNPNGGGALIDLLNWTADMLRGFIALPEPVKIVTSVLTGLIGVVALAGGTALLAVPKIAAFRAGLEALNIQGGVTKAALSGLSKVLLNPWTLAAVAAIAVIGKLIDEHAKYEARVEDLTTTLDANTGAITANTRASVAKSLQDQGAYENAKRMGLSIETLTDAAMGQADAMDEVRAKTLKYNSEHVVGETVARQFGQSIVDNVLSSVGREADAIDGAKDAHKNLSEAQKTGVQVTKDAANAYLDASSKANELVDTLGKLVDKINEANGVGQDAITSNNAYHQALADVDKQIENVRKGVEGYGSGLDAATEAGRKNSEMLVTLAKKGQDSAKAQFDLDHNTENYIANLQAGRDAVLQRAKDLGATDEQIRFLSDHIVAMPDEKTIKIVADTAAAANAFDRFIADITSRRPTLYIQGKVLSPGQVAYNYQGGMYERGVKAFASGGFASGIYKGVDGGIHKFAEKEAGVPWETYISGRASDRERNIGLWEETGRRLGAMQSAPPRYASPVGAGVPVAGATVNVTTYTQQTGKQIAADVARELRWAQ